MRVVWVRRAVRGSDAGFRIAFQPDTASTGWRRRPPVRDNMPSASAGRPHHRDRVGFQIRARECAADAWLFVEKIGERSGDVAGLQAPARNQFGIQINPQPGPILDEPGLRIAGGVRCKVRSQISLGGGRLCAKRKRGGRPSRVGLILRATGKSHDRPSCRADISRRRRCHRAV